LKKTRERLPQFEKKMKGKSVVDVNIAKLKLSQMLDYASKLESHYSVLRTIDSVIGSGIPSSPCWDWAEDVWKYMHVLLLNDESAKQAFIHLGLDISINHWKSNAAEAHYTVGIRLIGNNCMEEYWEIDNGYAWMYIPWDRYAVGSVFDRQEYDPNNNRFVGYDVGYDSILK